MFSRITNNMPKDTKNTLKFSLKPYRTQEYQDAVQTLNRLQTNASVIHESIRRGEKGPSQSNNIHLTNKYLKRCGINLEDFERRIGIVHVSGTKGKGTTCALCESCLRAHGYKTGLFTSPHLINVAERIRIDGEPLPPEQFVRHFWSVYNTLETSKVDDKDMPSYFKFLTIMAFSVFLKEEVDVAIVEVGIGGELDCTNVFRNTPIVGITSLDLDHTNVLGDNIDSIAWQKGGIIKTGSQCFTVQGHDSSALKVLKGRCIEKKTTLTVVPPLEHYVMDISSMSPVVKLNASLAIQLTHAFINWKSGIDNRLMPVIGKLDPQTNHGLLSCSWPGRCQKLVLGNMTFYLDGAHTSQSGSLSANWFDTTAPRDKKRALLFNCTGGRDPSSILQHFTKCFFNIAIFSTNNMTNNENPIDMVRVGSNNTDLLRKCEYNRQVWEQLLQGTEYSNDCEIRIADSVASALETFQQNQDVITEYHVLVTGSLHLVGSTLAVVNNLVDCNANGC